MNHLPALRLASLATGFLLTILSTANAQLGLKLSGAATNSPSVAVTNDPSVVPVTGITVEAWMTLDETGANNFASLLRHTVGSTGVGSLPTYNIRVESPNNQRRLAFKLRTAGGMKSANYFFAPGEFLVWTHVAGTYNGSEVKIFINGVEQGKNAQTGVIADQGGELSIGSGGRKNNAETWNGEIDEVRLWPYARTSAEIMSTMNLALVGVPGEVSTWNLDLTPNDTSGNNHGSDYNSPTYAANTLTLTPAIIGAWAFGKATAGCAGTPAIGASGMATAGNNGFAVMCVNGATSAGFGGLWVGVGKLATPFPFLGADFWVDTGALGVLIAVAGDANGLVRVDLPIPASMPVGAVLETQMFFNEAGCKVPLFASGGMTITMQ